MFSSVPALLEPQCPDQIRSRPRPTCYLCLAPGVPLYESVKDGVFGTPGIWNFKRCPNPACGLVWLDPMPIEEDIGKAYTKYYTHGEGPLQQNGRTSALRRVGAVLFSVVNPIHQERESLSLMHLDKLKPGKLLDVGCGGGLRLARLRSMGWDVYGQDVDPLAVTHARETLGLKAYLGPLQDMPFEENSFDCITLNHVIEHAHDPLALLKETRRLLKVGGLLVIVTPNASSFACKHFEAYWRGLEPPRHIHLFSPKTLTTIATKAGFTISCSATTAANAKSFGRASLLIRNGGGFPRTFRGKVQAELYPLVFLYRSIIEHSRDANSGEECVLRATH